MTPQELEPVPRVPETFVPAGIRHPVQNGQTWVSLATLHGLSDPWDLINHNFPGMKALHQINPKLATRYVNWYLHLYVGCDSSTDGGSNWAFRSGLPSTLGKGGWKGGHIYLPASMPTPTPIPTPTPAAPCVVQIASLPLPLAVQGILQLVKVRLPSQARCLDPTEVAYARGFYADSLVYDDIYVSDAHGADKRPVTIALPTGSRWIVVLNVGPTGFSTQTQSSMPATLIHELAHAWQSQHHPVQPMKFMWNCAMSQVEAAALTATDNKWVRMGLDIGGIPNPNPYMGEADAYAYIPGKPHRNYGGEQIAQQVEDSSFYPTRLNRGGDLAAARAILNRMKTVPRGASDSENISSLNSTKVAFEKSPGVVWHDQRGLPVYP